MLVVVGEALMDMVPDTCSGGDGHRARPGGSPFNVALGCARLDLPTAFLGRVSTDRFGRTLLAHLRDNGVRTDWVVEADDPTSLAFVHTDEHGVAEYDFYMQGTADLGLRPEHLADPPSPGALHVGSISLVVQPIADTVRTLVQEHHDQATISLDPNVRAAFITDRESYDRRLRDLLSMTHVVKVSDEDLAWLAPDHDPVEVARQWLDLGPALVVVTRGPEGAHAVTPDDHVHVPGRPVDVVDTVGAGDSFMSALLAWLDDHDALAGLRTPSGSSVPGPEALEEMLRWCVTAAAVTCRRTGADPPHRADLTDA